MDPRLLEEDRLKLDPQMVAFLQSRTQAEAPPAPPSAPPDQSQPDPQVMALLGQQDAEASDYNARQDLKEGIGRSMSYFLRRPVNPDVGAPKVDDSMRRYLISRKAVHASAPVDPIDQQIKGLRAKLMEKELTAPPKPDPAEKVPPAQHAEYVRRGAALKRPVLPTEGEPPKDFARRVESQEQEEASIGPKRSAEASGLTFELRKEFNKLPAVQDMETAATAYRKIQTTSETGAGDISLIFAYMKMLDPGSTVREGEFATAANAGSIPQTVSAAYNKAVNGEKLDSAVRAQFKSEARSVYEATKKRYGLKATQYRRLAQKHGMDPNDVVSDMGLEPDPPPAGKPASAYLPPRP